MTRILLVGGCEKDERKLTPRLATHGVEVGWHWMDTSAISKMPPACEGVLLFTQACSHSLSGGVGILARRASVPVISFDSWSRLWPAMVNAGLIPSTPTTEKITISTKEPVMAEPSVATSLPSMGHWASHFPSDEEMVQLAQAQWEGLSAKNKQGLSQYLCAFDRDPSRTFPMPFSVRCDLMVFEGKPRAYVAFVMLASKDFMVTAATIGFTYYTLFGKGLDHNTSVLIAAVIQSSCGNGYGLRKGVPGGGKKVHTPVEIPPADSTDPVTALSPTTTTHAEVSLTPKDPARNFPRKPSDDDVFLSAHSDWDKKDKHTQEQVRSFLVALDADSKAEMPLSVRTFLLQYDGQPRAFVVLCILATKDCPVLSSTVEDAYQMLSNKNLRTMALPKMLAKVQEFYGQVGYGFRRVRGTSPRFIPVQKPAETIKPAKIMEQKPVETAKIPVARTPQQKVEAAFEQDLAKSSQDQAAPSVQVPPTQENPMVASPASTTDESPLKGISIEDRFTQHVLKSVEAGEKITVYKDGGAYVVTYDDHEVLFRSKT